MYYRFGKKIYKTDKGLINALLKSNPMATEAGVDDEGKWYVGREGVRLYLPVQKVEDGKIRPK